MVSVLITICKTMNYKVLATAASNQAANVILKEVRHLEQTHGFEINPIRYSNDSEEANLVLAFYWALHDYHAESGEGTNDGSGEQTYLQAVAAQVRRTNASRSGNKSRELWDEASLHIRTPTDAGILEDGVPKAVKPTLDPDSPYKALVDAFYDPDHEDKATESREAAKEASQAAKQAVVNVFDADGAPIVDDPHQPAVEIIPSICKFAQETFSIFLANASYVISTLLNTAVKLIIANLKSNTMIIDKVGQAKKME